MEKFLSARARNDEYLALALANRHGLVTGATGTGKTVSLQVLAEGFSRAGVPVFAADVKGDLSGIAAPGEAKPDFVKRAKGLGFDYEPEEFPVVFWDLFGEQGHPIRATDLRDGAAAAFAHSRTQRCAGRRHQHRLPLRRRRSGIEGGGRRPDSSISRICASSCRIFRRTPKSSARATAMSR